MVIKAVTRDSLVTSYSASHSSGNHVDDSPFAFSHLIANQVDGSPLAFSLKCDLLGALTFIRKSNVGCKAFSLFQEF